VAYYNRGLAKEKMRQYKEALEDYDTADKLGYEKAKEAIQRVNNKMLEPGFSFGKGFDAVIRFLSKIFSGGGAVIQ